jgi:mono/diheme cytochrome c family protein
MGSLSWRVVIVVLAFGLAPVGADPPKAVTAADERHFATKVLPVLQAKCLACHGNDPEKLKGQLDLRSRAAMLEGGVSGKPAVVAGKPDDSPLFLAVSRQSTEWHAMPPKANDKLSDHEVSAIKDWIAAGAPWPSAARIAELSKAPAWDTKDGVTVRTSGGLTADWTNRKYRPEDLWAFRPVRKPAVPQADAANPIDAFLAVKAKALGLTPAPPADRRSLLRRVTFDLTGLPPTAAEIDAFLADKDDDDRAFGKVVDRLLASPHYGERMAQHWLDVTRYADSAGFANDYERGPAWRYRDYVVCSFNTDKPYDRFVKEQLAGDEMDATNPELLVAVGFLRMGPWELTNMEVPRVARQRFLDDVNESVGQTFLALPLQCARCHDHKFDPIPTRDYYAIQAVFATTQIADREADFLPDENRTGFQEQVYLEQRRRRYEEELTRLRTAEAAALRRWEQDHPRDAGKKPERHRYLSPNELGLERVTSKGLERVRWQQDRYAPFALSVYSGRTPDRKAVLAPVRLPADRDRGELEATAILAGGDPFSPKEAVTPGVLSAVNAGTGGGIPTTVGGRRKAFAEWVAAPSNPFTARVMVNRIWAWHFGTPLAGNPNNFGATGKKPTHPELLDWLAATFVEQQWSVKSVHRLILLSAAYRRSAHHPEPQRLARLDPLGTSYAAFKPRRLSAEEIRDAMLASTGELNRQLGGIPCRPEMNAEVAFQPRQVMGTFAESWQPNPKPAQRHRRSLYTLRLRGLRDPFFAVFDQPAPESACELRASSTVAPQAFALFNSESSFTRALALANAARAEAKSETDAIRTVFRRTLGREPTADEARACLAHWQSMTERHRRLTFARRTYPAEVTREAVEENTGEKFRFTEPLEMIADFIPDLQPADCSAEVRGLAEVCLVLFNTNEFLTVE